MRPKTTTNRHTTSGKQNLTGWAVAFLLLIAAGTATAQSYNAEKFAREVAQNSEQNCPKAVNGLVIDSLSYHADYLHFGITMEDIYMFGRDTAELKEYFANLLRYRYETQEFRDLYSLLVEIGGGMSYDMTLDSSRRFFVLRYPPEEIRQIWADRTNPEYQDSARWLARHDVFIELFMENRFTFSRRSTDEEFMVIDTVRQVGETVTYDISVADPNFLDAKQERDTYRNRWEDILLFGDEKHSMLSMFVNAGYDLRIFFENVSRTDSFQILFPHDTLLLLVDKAKRITSADDEEMEKYMAVSIQKETEYWQEEVNDNPEMYKSAEVSYHDRHVLISLTMREGTMNFNMDPDEYQSTKNLIATQLRNGIETSLDPPYSISDTVIVTSEEFYQYMEGYRVLFMEENTRRAIDIDLTMDEIKNAKLPVLSADDNTLDKIHEQFLAEQFVRDLAKFNREECPLPSGIMTIDSLTYDFEELHFHCHLDSAFELKGDTVVKQTLLKQFAFAKEESPILKTLLQLHGGLKVHYLIPAKDTTVTIYFPHAEILELFASDDTLTETDQARIALNSIIENANRNLPVLIDYLTRLDSMYLDGGSLVYHYTILNQFELLKENVATLNWAIRSQFASNDAEIQYLLLVCVRSGYGICYRYEPIAPTQNTKKKAKKSKKKDVVNLCFPPEELQGFIRE